MSFTYKNWPQIRYFIDDYIKHGKNMGLYNYISRYLYIMEIPFESERKIFGKDYDDFFKMQERFKSIEPGNELFIIILNTNLEFNYNNYLLTTEVPTMEENKSFEKFCNRWDDIYSKSKKRLLERVFYPMQLSFKQRILNPHTEIGYRYMVTNMDKLF